MCEGSGIFSFWDVIEDEFQLNDQGLGFNRKKNYNI